MRRLLALVLLLVGGCTAPDSPSPAPVPAPTTPAVAVQSMPRAVDALPWWESRLPRRVPRSEAGLPRLVDDPPGRATVVYHPPEHWPEPVEGWAGETLLFHGVDGRWRAMRMDELGLDDATWGSHDTYGAGSLSPDGRWWAGQQRTGVVLLDLATGKAETIAMGTRFTYTVDWRTDSQSLLVHHGSPPRTEVLELSSGRRTRLPFDSWKASPILDGTALSVRVRRGLAEVLEWHGSRRTSLGAVEVPGLRPDRGRSALYGPDAVPGRLLLSAQRPPYRTLDLVVVDTDGPKVAARLHLDVSARRGYRQDGWLDEETVLLEWGPGLVAWRPDDGTFWRVMDVDTPRNGYATLDVATDLAARP